LIQYFQYNETVKRAQSKFNIWKQDLENDIYKLKEIQALHVKISEFKNRLKKETNSNDKVNLNIELKKLNDKLDKLQGSL